MGVNTRTTWSAEDWKNGDRTASSLDRDTDDPGLASLKVDQATIRLTAEELRDLSKAAALIADELDAE